MDKLRIAVLGCGDIAVRSYLPMIVKLRDNVELAATCDIVPERAERASREFGAERSFADPETLVSKANVDGILVLTPMSSHGQLALLGLEAGKHVYVEKVMAPDLVTADRMIDLAEKQHLTLACAPSTILLSAFQRTRELIEQGEIGQVCLVHALAAHRGPARSRAYTTDPSWYYQPGAGLLFDLAVYPVHVLTQILGPVKRVLAVSGLAVPEIVMTPKMVHGQRLEARLDDTASMLLDFGGATFASIDVSYNVWAARLPAMQFWGSRGALTAPQFMGDEVAIWREDEGRWEAFHLPSSQWDGLGFAAGLLHWLECIREGVEPINDGRHARHVLEVLLAGYESSRTGCAIELAAVS